MNKFLSKLWTAAAFFPFLLLLLLLALQTLPSLDSRALWFSDEIRYGNVLEHVLYAKKWLVMYLNGVPYPDKPPVYFWFLAAFMPIFKAPTAPLFFAGAAASALLFLVATLSMNHGILREKNENGLGAGLILLTCFYFVALAQYSRMDLLFTTFITFAHICFYRAWQREKATGLLLLGFALCAVATLTKGPLGFVFPVLASIVYLAITGRISRFFRRDVAYGFLLSLVILGAWIAGAWFSGEQELIKNIFYKQIYRRALNASHHQQPFWHYFATFPAALLPWTFVIFLLPLKKLVQGPFWSTILGKTARHADVDSTRSGQIYLWCALLSGFILLTSLSTKIVVYLMPLFPPLSLLLAQGVLNLPQTRVKYFIRAFAVLLTILGLATLFVNAFTPWPTDLKYIWVMAPASILMALLLWFWVAKWDIRPALLSTAVLMALWVQPLAMLAVPSLDPIMSPKAQGELMGKYIRAGYTPAAYKIYSGVYTYYCGSNILETQDLEKLGKMAQTEKKFVLGMQKRYWDSWKNRPANLHVIHEQWIADRPYVLLINGPALSADPASKRKDIVPMPMPTVDPVQPKATPAPAHSDSVTEAQPAPQPNPARTAEPQKEAIDAPAAPQETPGLFALFVDGLEAIWDSVSGLWTDDTPEEQPRVQPTTPQDKPESLNKALDLLDKNGTAQDETLPEEDELEPHLQDVPTLPRHDDTQKHDEKPEVIIPNGEQIVI
ncbi:glycosyltransferase family 39 protein [Desulfobaculum bizertense]|uniref:glycosyltransferase family 39 protein n=1 Tax=Desulfobaculum bizertense TaxID=376490 RepID=UPI001F28F6AD|nr:glycosyltransferase family 39 protein [Desulfobaculum bizertense]UIJ38084.1 glycosyltransferase family 39 protein [Desulfobaculum bizertense]